MGLNGKRVLGGVAAQLSGVTFENLFLKRCALSGIIVTRIPDGCRQLSARKLIRVKTPFDFILTLKGQSAFIDTKSTLKDTFTHGHIDPDQLRHLAPHEAQGAYAGYVIHLRSKGKVFYMPALILMRLQYVRGSFDETYPGGKLLGSSEDFDPRLIFT